jgi:hypothetical protein
MADRTESRGEEMHLYEVVYGLMYMLAAAGMRGFLCDVAKEVNGQ